jgi:hypothetical protein
MIEMRVHPPLNATLIFFFVGMSAAFAQDEGIGSFNQLVGQALEPEKTPTPQVMFQPAPPPEQLKALGLSATEAKSAVAIEKEEAPAWSYVAGLEYDYRFNQQQIGDQFGTDINEIHPSLLILYGTNKFLIEYFHIWSDATNDSGLTKTSDGNGIKLSLSTQLFHAKPTDICKIDRELRLSLPFSFRDENFEALTVAGRRMSDVDSYTLNPFLTGAISWALEKDRTLKLSLSPGYRLGISDKDFTNVHLPHVHSWKGTVQILPRLDYDVTKMISVNASVTWAHLTNYYSSDGAPPPDPDVFSLATGVTVKQKLLDKLLSVELDYQYDGFNRDYYQHTVTLLLKYQF